MMALRCEALLFDLDGVLVYSDVSVRRSWRAWAREQRLDPAPILERAQGRRTIDTIRQSAPGVDAEAHAVRLESLQASDLSGVEAAPGARELLMSIPDGRWAIVTSGSRPLATARLRWTGLPVPDVLITGDDVGRGKPDPEGYLTAAANLGYAASACVVIEDSAAGLAAAMAASCAAVAVVGDGVTRHPASALAVTSVDSLCVRIHGQQLHISVRVAA